MPIDEHIPPPPELTMIGNDQPICPYCTAPLPKMYHRKTPCPACGQDILKRTRPLDGQHILIREDQDKEVQIQWWVKTGDYEINMRQAIEKAERYQRHKETLQKRFGAEPSDGDVKWSIYNEDLEKHINDKQWGLYAFVLLEMARHLIKEEKYDRALDLYLESLFLDINGASNGVGEFPGYPPFDRKLSFIMPDTGKVLKEICKALNITDEELHTRFNAAASRMQKTFSRFRMPYDPAQAWRKLEKELKALK